MRRMKMRGAIAAAMLTLLALPASAADFPKSPKIGPPEPLPGPSCDVAAASTGEWLVGHWVAPHTKWSFSREGSALVWIMDRKGFNDGFGWSDGATITGTVETATGCTVTLKAGEGAFLFDGVLTDAGHLFGYATNTRGDNVRFTLRRQR